MKQYCIIFALLIAVSGAIFASDSEMPTWHCHSRGTPEVLFIAESPEQQSLAERWRAQLPAHITFAPLKYGHLEMHHLCDKPLEESKKDQQYVKEQGRKFVNQQLDRINQFDVVIARLQPKSKQWRGEIATRVASYAKKGGNLIFINSKWNTTFKNTPWADFMPVKHVRGRTWTSSPGRSTDHPLARGIPLSVAGSHWYGPRYQPVNDRCHPLTDNSRKAGFWIRDLAEGGRVVHLYSVYGKKTSWGRGTNYSTYDPNRPDDRAVWDAFMRRLVYGLTYGKKAFPVLTDISLPPGRQAEYGQKMTVPVDVQNRSDNPRTIKIVLSMTHRRTGTAQTQTRAVDLSPGQRQTLDLALTPELPCSDSYVQLQCDAVDSSRDVLLSRSSAWMPYKHGVPITVATDKAAYQPGQDITTTVRWPASARPSDYQCRVWMADRQGRVLQKALDTAVSITDKGEGTEKTTLTMLPGGPQVASSYWAIAALYSGDTIVGIDRVQVQNNRPWNMRRQFQWSVWSWGGAGRLIDLYRDAGFNALGMKGNCYTADRYGMHQYVESTGINTFGVTIDHDNWDAVRQKMRDQIVSINQKQGVDSRSKSLVSLGEESGFKGGWGTRYYWEKDRAPDHVQSVFDDYLRQKYDNDITILNREWGTEYTEFDDIPLKKDYVRQPRRVFVTAQAWEGMKKGTKKRRKVPVKPSDGSGPYLALAAPYRDSYGFFDWYYQKYCDMATEVYRNNRNPVPRTIMSAPGGFYPKVDVYNFGSQGPFYPKEGALAGNMLARRRYGDVPGFSGAMWAYFDLRSLWSCNILSTIAVGNTHMDYWVDTPLTFNADLTHTRASFWTRILRERLRPVEPILLHKRIEYTPGLGFFVGQQPVPRGLFGRHFRSSIQPNAAPYSALEKSGFMPKAVGTENLDNIKVLVASYAQVISPEQAEDLADFVRSGGLLVSTPWLGACSPHGNMLEKYPGQQTGLSELLGFKLRNTSQKKGRWKINLNFKKIFGAGTTRPFVSKGRDEIVNRQPDVEVVAEYDDGTPLLLSRRVGRGRIVYLNAVYDWDGWWNAFHHPHRETYRRLFKRLVNSGGVRRNFFWSFRNAEKVDDNRGWWGMKMKTRPQAGDSVAWWGSTLYTDPSGNVSYLMTFADHRSPMITAELQWPDANVAIYDLLNGGRVSDRIVSLRPGEAAYLAITRKAPADIKLDAPGKITAGESLDVNVEVVHADPETEYGLTVRTYGPDGESSPSHSVRNATMTGGSTTLRIPTAVNDKPGTYRLVVTEAMTRKRAETSVELLGPESAPNRRSLTPFVARSSEQWPVLDMSDEEFLNHLKLLRNIYEAQYKGLEAKYMLSFFLNVPFRPNNRHAILHRMLQTRWMPHVDAVSEFISGGESLYLFGEDLNVDPETGQSIYPFAVAKPRAFIKALASREGARRRTVELAGRKVHIISIGKGQLITGPASVDRTAYHSSDFIEWHERIRNDLLNHQ